ncbi:MAG: FAD assembly factor SdhE [Sulfuricella sp.]
MSDEEWVMGGNEEEGKEFPHHPSPITHYGASRIRWDCRRGMLELDIVLARFMEQNFERLTPQEVEAFKGLLAYSDPDLWGLIQGSGTGGDDEIKTVLQLLRGS